MNSWQKIDTAPKDRTKIDVWVESIDLKRKISGERVVDVFWKPDAKDDVSFSGGEWLRPSDRGDPPYAFESSNRRATHWMPQPEPPK